MSPIGWIEKFFFKYFRQFALKSITNSVLFFMYHTNTVLPSQSEQVQISSHQAILPAACTRHLTYTSTVKCHNAKCVRYTRMQILRYFISFYTCLFAIPHMLDLLRYPFILMILSTLKNLGIDKVMFSYFGVLLQPTGNGSGTDL